MKLNLGCGTDVRDGFVNVDRVAYPGVVQADLAHLPDEWTDRVDYVAAFNVLEHVLDFVAVWREIHRVLKVGGILEFIVPYKHDYYPPHLRGFTRHGLMRLTREGQWKEARHGINHTLDLGPWYTCVGFRYLPPSGFPWWHVWHYSGERIVLRRHDLHVSFEKVA